MYNVVTRKEFETKDFYLAALLMVNGFRLSGSRKNTTDSAVYFQMEIDDEDEFNKVMHDFVNYNAMVNMNKFVKIIGKLRHELDKHRK